MPVKQAWQITERTANVLTEHGVQYKDDAIVDTEPAGHVTQAGPEFADVI